MRCRLVKTLESPLDSKGMKSVNPKGNQSWIFIGRIAAEAETLILWPPNSKNWLIGKDLYTRKDWRQEEKGMTENEMVGWHHQLDGHEFEQTPGDSEGWGSLVCCSPWGCKSQTWLSDWTRKLVHLLDFWGKAWKPIVVNGWIIFSSLFFPPKSKNSNVVIFVHCEFPCELIKY